MQKNYADFQGIFLVLMTVFFMTSCGNTSSQSVLPKTTNGYAYIHHIKNDGPKIQIGDEVEYHQITRKNSEILQSSHYYGRPIKIVIPPLEQVASPIHPVYEGLQLMANGDSMTLIQLLDTVSNLPPKLKPTDTLSYDVIVLNVRSAEEVEKEMALVKARAEDVKTATLDRIDKYVAGSLNNEIKTSESGLKYIIHNEGEGKQPVAGQKVLVHYTGYLTDKTNFDNSYDRGTPIDFPLGKGAVIKGWDEGVALLKEGGSATFFIPYQLAYGEAGRPPSIPAKAELIFYVELTEVQ